MRSRLSDRKTAGVSTSTRSDMVRDQGRPRRVLVAGMPRSGSTWLFNAARLLCAHSGQGVQAVWVDDYDPADIRPMHLVKVHRPEQADTLPFLPDRILTTWRPYEACLASLVRIGWLNPDPDAVRARYASQKTIYEDWAERSDLEIDHADIVAEPAAALAKLSRSLGQADDPLRNLDIGEALGNMKPPEDGPFDKVTLLHPRHRKHQGEVTKTTPKDILRVLEGHS
ncbi:hypothetical protein [Palleronia rufa]